MWDNLRLAKGQEMQDLRIVIDSNVLVAAARSKRGASHALLSLLPDPRFQPAVSVPLFAEYRVVLQRPENLLSRSAAQADAFLDYLLSVSHLQEVFYLWRPALPDPNDEIVLELAVAAGCRYIVTHNIRDFRGSERWATEAVTPASFNNLIEERNEQTYD